MIRFLCSYDVKTSEIKSDNYMSLGNVYKWAKIFNEWQKTIVILLLIRFTCGHERQRVLKSRKRSINISETTEESRMKQIYCGMSSDSGNSLTRIGVYY